MDIISVAHVLNFICASKRGDGSLECFVLQEKGNSTWFQLEYTFVTGLPNSSMVILSK